MKGVSQIKRKNDNGEEGKYIQRGSGRCYTGLTLETALPMYRLIEHSIHCRCLF